MTKTTAPAPVLISIAAVLILLGLTLVVGGCDSFLLEDQYNPIVESLELALRPSIAVVEPHGTLTFSAIGGLSPYRFSISDESLGSIDQDTGEFQASASMGSTTVWVQDTENSRVSAFVFVQEEADLSLTAQSGSIQQGGSTMLFPAGGAPPYHITIAPTGHDLVYEDPEGLGTISGNNTYNAGNSVGTVQIRVTDSANDFVEIGVEVVPEMPLGFEIYPRTNNQIDLEWGYVRPGISEFRVMKSVDNEPFADISGDLVIINIDGVYTAEDDNVSPNRLYQYKVYAVVSHGGSTIESPPAGPKSTLTNLSP